MLEIGERVIVDVFSTTDGWVPKRGFVHHSIGAHSFMIYFDDGDIQAVSADGVAAYGCHGAVKHDGEK